MTEPTPLEQGAAAYKRRHPHTEAATSPETTKTTKAGRDAYARRHPNREKN